ncbi:MAG: carbon starvation protein A, partial [Candidatus Omnitrophica bacterium]|nr:carbon starvation protein A [Candidatus Omnitrophota bacterium]
AGLWLRKKGKPSWFVLLPMIFMLVTAFSALCDTVLRYRFGILGLVGAVLLFLSFLLVLEAARIFLPAAEKRI